MLISRFGSPATRLRSYKPFRQAVADPADANVIRSEQRDAVPGQRAIGSGEIVAVRAGSAGFGCVLVSTVARCPYASVEEKRKTTAARTNFALFLFAPE